ncbi:MAG: glycosyltransferase family 2 protein [Deltaproteobacteria bacterium]|nr:glycosyltransferase family 2 protein [Deltaproteobacteria bacterium]
MDVSIVIVSYNTCRILDECIVSIKKEMAASYEIIVVDNASKDDSCRMLREKYPEVLLIENSENAGFARANNQGFAIAKGKYFFMLNSDTVILDRAIDKLIEFMEKNPWVGVCGPRNVGRDGDMQYSCDHFPSFWNTLWEYSNLVNRYPQVKMFKRSRMRYWDYSDVKDVERIAGCTLMLRSDLYVRLGGLDNNYFMYFEETDLCYRVIREGYRVVYLPHAVIVHYGGESSKMQTGHAVINRTIYSYFLGSQYYFYRKNYGFFPMLAVRSLDFVYGLALLARNAARKDRLKRAHSLAKGKALCANALRF